MISPSDYSDPADQVPRGPRRRRPFPSWRVVAIAGSLALLLLAAGYGLALLAAGRGSSSPGTTDSVSSQSQFLSEEVTWAQCIRAHGVPSFPDPGSNGAFDSGRWDPDSPAFKAASAACKAVEPNGPVQAVPGAS